MANKFAGGIKADSTSVSIPIILRKTSDSTELTGVASGSVTASYQRQGAAVVPITVSALGSAIAAYSSGGWFEKDGTNQPGHYRLDIPDAAFASGVEWVIIAVKVSTAFVFYERFNLETKGAAEVVALIGVAGAGLTAIGDTSGTTTLLARLTAPRAGYLDNIATAAPTATQVRQEMDSNSTRLAALVAGVTVSDKTGFILAAAGLDQIPIETGVNARQALSPILAACAGVVSGAGTGSITIKGGNVATTRIVATTDNSGNRSAVGLTLPA